MTTPTLEIQTQTVIVILIDSCSTCIIILFYSMLSSLILLSYYCCYHPHCYENIIQSDLGLFNTVHCNCSPGLNDPGYSCR